MQFRDSDSPQYHDAESRPDMLVHDIDVSSHQSSLTIEHLEQDEEPCSHTAGEVHDGIDKVKCCYVLEMLCNRMDTNRCTTNLKGKVVRVCKDKVVRLCEGKECHVIAIDLELCPGNDHKM